MPTVYKRLKHYCLSRRKKPLTLDQKALLGDIIRRHYFPPERESKEVKLPPHSLIEQEEPEGTFRVISYPKSFSPTIDRLIHSFYGTLKPQTPPPARKERKRIPVKK